MAIVHGLLGSYLKLKTISKWDVHSTRKKHPREYTVEYENSYIYNKMKVSKRVRDIQTVNVLKSIRDDIESNHYSIEDFRIHIIHEILLNKMPEIKEITEQSVLRTKEIYENTRLKHDKNIIFLLNERLKLDIIQLFSVRESGMSYIYELIKKGTISPNFYLRFFDKTKLEIKDFSDDSKWFDTIVRLIKVELTNKQRSVTNGN